MHVSSMLDRQLGSREWSIRLMYIYVPNRCTYAAVARHTGLILNKI